MKKSATIRIIVPTHKRPDDLVTFLNALMLQLDSWPNVRLTVVNDGSHDDNYERAIGPYKSRFDYRIRAESGGCGAARQTGLEGVCEDYIVTTDDDCIPPPYWLAQLNVLVEMHPEIDVFSGDVVFVPSDRSGFVEQYFIATHQKFASLRTKYGFVKISAAGSAIKRNILERCGGFASDYDVAEDFYLSQQLIAAGASVLDSKHWQIGHKSGHKLNSEMRRYYKYGYYGARYLLRERDWRSVPLYVNAGQRLKTSFAGNWIHWNWQAINSQPMALARKILLLGISVLILAALRSGWYLGLRHYRRRYDRDLPTAPPIADRLSNCIFGPTVPRDPPIIS